MPTLPAGSARGHSLEELYGTGTLVQSHFALRGERDARSVHRTLGTRLATLLAAIEDGRKGICQLGVLGRIEVLSQDVDSVVVREGLGIEGVLVLVGVVALVVGLVILAVVLAIGNQGVCSALSLALALRRERPWPRLRRGRQRCRGTTAPQVVAAMHGLSLASRVLNPKCMTDLLQVILIANRAQHVQLLPVVPASKSEKAHSPQAFRQSSSSKHFLQAPELLLAPDDVGLHRLGLDAPHRRRIKGSEEELVRLHRLLLLDAVVERAQKKLDALHSGLAVAILRDQLGMVQLPHSLVGGTRKASTKMDGSSHLGSVVSLSPKPQVPGSLSILFVELGFAIVLRNSISI